MHVLFVFVLAFVRVCFVMYVASLYFAAIPCCIDWVLLRHFFDARLSTGGMLYRQNFFMILQLFPATYLDTFLISLKLYIWFLWLYLFYGCICFDFLLCVLIRS